MILAAALVALTAAHADDAAYQSCCRAAGVASCPAELLVVDETSEVRGDAAVGLWRVACGGGAVWDPAARAYVRGAGAGEVTPALSPTAAACFAAACPLPDPVCLAVDGPVTRATRCAGPTLAAAAADWLAPERTRVAVVAGPGEVVAARVRTTPDRTPRVAPAPAPVATAPPRALPATPPAARASTTLTGATDPLTAFALPPPPPDPCRPDPKMRVPANDQVLAGDEARVAREVARALEHYRAALLVDRCNGYAWASIGGLLVDGGDARRAATALQHATRLTPTLTPAWVDLGRAREAIGDRAGAQAAYRTALQQRPTDRAAQEGLHRVSSTR